MPGAAEALCFQVVHLCVFPCMRASVSTVSYKSMDRISPNFVDGVVQATDELIEG